MKKFLLGFLSILLVVSMLAMPGCKKDDGEESSTTVVTQGGEQGITFPERDYEGAEYRILCTTQVNSFYETPETTDSVLTEAVYNRNLDVEAKYGVVLTFKAMEGRSGGGNAFASEIRTSSQGDSSYDLVVGQTYYTMALALEGFYYNLNNSEYLNLDQPWYDKELINDTIDIGGKLYACSGAYVISQITTAMGIYFNKTMYEDYKCDEIVGGKDIYQVVRDGEWTYEYMSAMTKLVYDDADNDKSYNNKDTYGFVANTHGPMSAMVGSDCPIAIDDGEGNLSISGYYDSHLISVFETYLDFFNNVPNVFYVASDEDLIAFFANGQSLFCNNAIEYLATSVVRDSGIDYGILPFPKYDELQEDYYTNTIRWEIAHIPATADLEKACIVFEYLNYTSHNIVNPAYFETVLSTQAVQVEEDSEMLQLVRQNIRFDFCTFYQTQIGESAANNIYLGVKSLIRNNDSGISSWWSTNKGSYEKKLSDLLDLYMYFLDEE